VRLVIHHALNVLEEEATNAPLAKLAFILKDGLAVLLLVLVIWLDMVHVNLSL
jgi:hypothetical protein